MAGQVGVAAQVSWARRQVGVRLVWRGRFGVAAQVGAAARLARVRLRPGLSSGPRRVSLAGGSRACQGAAWCAGAQRSAEDGAFRSPIVK